MVLVGGPRTELAVTLMATHDPIHISKGYRFNKKQCIFSYSDRTDYHARHQMSKVEILRQVF